MKIAGIMLVVIGVLILLAGFGMDTTKTTTTCYEADHSWDAADSSGCIETTYSNPAPKFAAMMLGISLALGGGVIVSRSDSSESAGYNSTDQAHTNNPKTNEIETGSFAEKLQERQNREELK